MNKEQIVKIIKEDTDQCIEIHKDYFRIICETVTVNEFCFRDVGYINIVKDKVLWIKGADIYIDDIHTFRIRKSWINPNVEE